jgi:hypothetical protein
VILVEEFCGQKLVRVSKMVDAEDYNHRGSKMPGYCVVKLICNQRQVYHYVIDCLSFFLNASSKVKGFPE